GLPETVVPKGTGDSSQWRFLKDSNLFLYNARSGIMILIDLLKPASVWMPSYLCPTMIEAVDQKKTNLRFYEIDYNLQISSVNWIEQIQTGDIVVLIDYFGFPLDSKVATLAKKRGGWILEDACQDLLSKHMGQCSDFILFSPRKFIGVPDGGIVVSCCDTQFDDIELEPPPESWWLKMLEATINRREFDKYGGERYWYKLFRETDAATTRGYYAMSELSRRLLFTAFEYSEIAQRRIENYSVLAHELRDMALFPELLEGTVPLGFPVRHSQRDQIRKNLFQEQIYSPVHWPLDQVTPEEFYGSRRLAEHIMTLPCDQRYDKIDMEQMAQIVLGELEC
ncbi:DegT/DnrJ/EryC1/StrS aminotransferase family protein, partial [bacterium]|nr:DegT/DnrJ/EryC1/StrS aminotransferase family protein [bacterium]